MGKLLIIAVSRRWSLIDLMLTGVIGEFTDAQRNIILQHHHSSVFSKELRFEIYARHSGRLSWLETADCSDASGQ